MGEGGHCTLRETHTKICSKNTSQYYYKATRMDKTTHENATLAQVRQWLSFSPSRVGSFGGSLLRHNTCQGTTRQAWRDSLAIATPEGTPTEVVVCTCLETTGRRTYGKLPPQTNVPFLRPMQERSASHDNHLTLTAHGGRLVPLFSRP